MRIGVVGLITIGAQSAGTSGGVEKLIEEVSVRLAGRGHDVTVYCRARYNPTGATGYRGVRLRNLPAIYTKHLEAISHALLSTLAAIPACEVIQFHSMGPALLSFIPRLFGRKTVCTLHGLDWKRGKWGRVARLVLRAGEWCALRFPNRTTVVSRHLEQHYAEAGHRVAWIPNGAPVMEPRPLEALRRFGLEPGRYLLYLGRFVPEKGSHALVEAFRELDTDLKLVMAGDARHAAGYFERVKAAAAGDERIVFTGPLYGAEKDEAFANAYAFCLPSDVEGMPLTLLEAMAAGRCCVASDIPEVASVLIPVTEHEPLGVLFRAGEVADLRARLREVLDAPGRAAALGERARAHVRAAYDWDRIARQYEALYAEVLGGQNDQRTLA